MICDFPLLVPFFPPFILFLSHHIPFTYSQHLSFSTCHLSYATLIYKSFFSFHTYHFLKSPYFSFCPLTFLFSIYYYLHHPLFLFILRDICLPQRSLANLQKNVIIAQCFCTQKWQVFLSFSLACYNIAIFDGLSFRNEKETMLNFRIYSLLIWMHCFRVRFFVLFHLVIYFFYQFGDFVLKILFIVWIG